MGNNNNTTVESPSLALPKQGYRILSVKSQLNKPHIILSNTIFLFKLSDIFTDYITTPNLPNFIKQSLSRKDQINTVQIITLQVFSILSYSYRTVRIPIVTDSESNFGIDFRYCSQINDSILRVSKVFKNSPVQKAQIKKNEYIVGIVEGDFDSIKYFSHAIRTAIHQNFQYITLAICNEDGLSRLVKIPIKELEIWNTSYGVGYLGCELAEGWISKWQLKKNLQEKIQSQNGNNVLSEQRVEQVEESEEQYMQPVQEVIYEMHKSPIDKVSSLQNLHDKMLEKSEESSTVEDSNKMAVKEFDPHESLRNQQKNDQKLKVQRPEEYKSPFKQLEKQNEERSHTLKLTQKQSKPEEVQHAQTISSAKSGGQKMRFSTEQISRKCGQLQSEQQRQLERRNSNRSNGSKPSQSNVMELTFKDDAATICHCQNYSKHCQKCFIEKDRNYYFFNKKTNKIVVIEAKVLFPTQK